MTGLFQNKGCCERMSFMLWFEIVLTFLTNKTAVITIRIMKIITWQTSAENSRISGSEGSVALNELQAVFCLSVRLCAVCQRMCAVTVMRVEPHPDALAAAGWCCPAPPPPAPPPPLTSWWCCAQKSSAPAGRSLSVQTSGSAEDLQNKTLPGRTWIINGHYSFASFTVSLFFPHPVMLLLPRGVN